MRAQCSVKWCFISDRFITRAPSVQHRDKSSRSDRHLVGETNGWKEAKIGHLCCVVMTEQMALEHCP